MATKSATILIGENYAHMDPNYLKSPNTKLPMSFDGDSIKYTIKILQEYGYSMKLITWEEYLRDTITNNNLIIVAQWILIRTKWEMNNLINFRKKVNDSIAHGCNFILMHHYWPEFPFSKLLDIDLYEDPQTHRTFFQNKRLFRLFNKNSELMNGVEDFINSNEFKSDEFIYIIRDNSMFETLIEKIPVKGSDHRFISFGFQKFDFNNYIFLIDIHNIGKIKTHEQLFSMLFHNTLNFINENGK